jgi:hypothetical protein
MEVVRDEGKAEACLLCPNGVVDEIEWSMLLARDRIAELHGCLLVALVGSGRGCPAVPRAVAPANPPAFPAGGIRVFTPRNLERVGSTGARPRWTEKG